MLWPKDLQVRCVYPGVFGRCDSLGPRKGQEIDAHECAKRTAFRHLSTTQRNQADTIDAWLAVQPERPAAERSADGIIRKERRQRCQGCGDPFSVFPLERERTSAYCAQCGDARRRAQARARMQARRARHRTGAG